MEMALKTKSMRSKIIFISGLLIFVGGVFLLNHSIQNNSANETAEEGKDARPVLAVEVVQPHRDVWPMKMKAHGALAPWQDVVVSAETGGLRISALHAEVGDTVEAGALLAELDDRTVKADLMKAEAALALAKAHLREAQANARRGRAVKGTGALSGQQIEQFEVALQVAQANLESAQAGLESARIRLSQTRIVALDAGIVSARTATLGAVVNAGSELFRLVRQGKVEWRAELDEEDITRIEAGDPATVTLRSGEAIEGIVRTLSPALDPAKRTALAYVDLPAHAQARPGSYVSGEIDLGQSDALNVPASAVVMRDGRSLVFEVQGEEVIQRAVLAGRSLSDRIELIEGGDSQMRLVRSGGAFLNDGDRVKVSDETQNNDGVAR